MEIDYSPYDFEKVDSEENIYLFDTDFELSYEIIFKHTPYLSHPINRIQMIPMNFQ
jgi:hypothetical protein